MLLFIGKMIFSPVSFLFVVRFFFFLCVKYLHEIHLNYHKITAAATYCRGLVQRRASIWQTKKYVTFLRSLAIGVLTLRAHAACIFRTLSLALAFSQFNENACLYVLSCQCDFRLRFYFSLVFERKKRPLIIRTSYT